MQNKRRFSIYASLWTLCVCIFACPEALAVEVTGKVLAISPDGDWITIERIADGAAKPATLDIRKGTTVAGVEVGKIVFMKFDPEAEEATDLRCQQLTNSRQASGSTSFLNLEELNWAYSDNEQCVSEDGLEIVWTRSKDGRYSIWNARRKDPDSVFTDIKELFAGRSPVLSSDRLQIIFFSSTSNCIVAAERKSTADHFGRPLPVASLRFSSEARPRWVSRDGLTIYVESNQKLLQIKRKTPMEEWGQRTNVKVDFGGMPDNFKPGYATGTPDPLLLLCSGNFAGQGTRIGVLRKGPQSETFTQLFEITLSDYRGEYPFVVRPQFVPATNELFLVSNQPLNGPQNGSPTAADIYVIKNFSLPTD